MIRKENRKLIQGAFLEVHRSNNRVETSDHSKYAIENISRGGLRFLSPDQYSVDERIEIILHLNNGEKHSLMARICYRDEPRTASNGSCCYGVSFLDHFLEIAHVI